jgi:hypothetical protein
MEMEYIRDFLKIIENIASYILLHNTHDLLGQVLA